MNLSTKFLTILIISVAATEALQCYQCTHRKPDFPGDRSPSTCEAGKPPKSAHIKECKDVKYDYIQLSSGNLLGVPRKFGLVDQKTSAPIIVPQQAEGNKQNYTCIKFTMNGKEKVNNTDLSTTLRGCLHVVNLVNGNYPDVCYEGANSKILDEIKEEELKRFSQLYQPFFTDQTTVGICSCNGDECNAAMGSVTVTTFLLFSTIILAVFQNAF